MGHDPTQIGSISCILGTQFSVFFFPGLLHIQCSDSVNITMVLLLLFQLSKCACLPASHKSPAIYDTHVGTWVNIPTIHIFFSHAFHLQTTKAFSCTRSVPLFDKAVACHILILEFTIIFILYFIYFHKLFFFNENYIYLFKILKPFFF